MLKLLDLLAFGVGIGLAAVPFSEDDPRLLLAAIIYIAIVGVVVISDWPDFPDDQSWPPLSM